MYEAPKLDGCPFCGHDVQFAINIEGWPHGIWCQCCHMKVDWSNLKDGPKKTAGQIMQQIAEKWNRRVTR